MDTGESPAPQSAVTGRRHRSQAHEASSPVIGGHRYQGSSGGLPGAGADLQR